MNSQEYLESIPMLPNLEYQCFKLKKRYEKRSVAGESVEVLKEATGLEFIHPDDNIKSNLIRNLMPLENENMEDAHEIIGNCEILIVVAMYNESSKDFLNTMQGINENLDFFKGNGVNPDKIACVIIVDGIKAFLEAYNKEKDFFSIIISGGFAGIAFWVFTYPIDFLKSRIQADSIANPKYSGTYNCFIKTLEEEGYRTFFRGFYSCILRAFPVNIGAFLGFELAMKFIGRDY